MLCASHNLFHLISSEKRKWGHHSFVRERNWFSESKKQWKNHKTIKFEFETLSVEVSDFDPEGLLRLWVPWRLLCSAPHLTYTLSSCSFALFPSSSDQVTFLRRTVSLVSLSIVVCNLYTRTLPYSLWSSSPRLFVQIGT